MELTFWRELELVCLGSILVNILRLVPVGSILVNILDRIGIDTCKEHFGKLSAGRGVGDVCAESAQSTKLGHSAV